MEQGFSHETMSILHELDLGRHTLFIMSDGSIDLLANDEQTPHLADNGMSLDSDETYRLFVSLQEQFQHTVFTGDYSEAYQALPRKVSNDILRQLDKAWRSFRGAMKAWHERPEKFLGRPQIPKYKHKTKGRFLLIYDKQAISKAALKRGMLAPSGLPIEIPTKQGVVKQARIVPRIGFYVFETVYERKEHPPTGDPNLYASIDLGVDNLAAITSNREGFMPRLINGRPLKSTNQFYNKCTWT